MQSASPVIPSIFNVQSDAFFGLRSVLGKKKTNTFTSDNMTVYPGSSIKSTLGSFRNGLQAE